MPCPFPSIGFPEHGLRGPANPASTRSGLEAAHRRQLGWQWIAEDPVVVEPHVMHASTGVAGASRNRSRSTFQKDAGVAPLQFGAPKCDHLRSSDSLNSHQGVVSGLGLGACRCGPGGGCYLVGLVFRGIIHVLLGSLMSLEDVLTSPHEVE